MINLVESGVSRQTIANRFGIGKSTVHDIHKRKNVILSFAQQNSTDLCKRRRLDLKVDMKVDDDFNRIVEEETIIENFDHEEFDFNGEEGYEIIETTVESNSDTVSKPLEELPSKLNQVIGSNSKRKSKTLTLREKWEILMQLEEGKSVSAIINKYDIGRTTLYDLKKQKQRIFEYIENSNGENRRTFKKSNYPEIENDLLKWCVEADSFTEQMFFEKYKQLFVHYKSRNLSIHHSQFTGSWSWCRRFFERNPEYKKKILPCKDINNSAVKAEKKLKDPKSCENTDIQNFSFNATDNATSKLVNTFNSDMFKLEKNCSLKMNLNPELEKELTDWCLRQKTFPSFSSIADRAYNIFVTMDLEGDFNPSRAWAMKFVRSHAELFKRCCYEQRTEPSFTNLKNFSDDENSTIENGQEESIELIEPDFMKSDIKINSLGQDDYGNEYIVEELDDNHSEDLDMTNVIEESKNTRKKLEDRLVNDEEAMNSLKVLIRYSEQRGHEEISALLVEYQNILMEENFL